MNAQPHVNNKRFRSGGITRLALGLLTAATASLTVLTPPEDPWRRYSTGATEWGQFIALLGLSTLPGARRTWLGALGATVALPTAILALNPLLRAAAVARDLPDQLAAAFGDVTPQAAPGAPQRSRPLSYLDLFRGVRSPTVPVQTLVYSAQEGEDLTLDLYRAPSTITPAPLVVIVHGGSWQTGDSRQLPALNTYLAARGYIVAAINYRKAPRHTFPAAVDDVRDAIAYLKKDAAAFGIDPDRLALVGRSAGGHLALLAAYANSDPAIRGVVAFYTPIDMPAAVIDPSDPSKINEDGVIAQFLGGGLSSIPDVYTDATPLNFVGPSTPPTLLIHGGRDKLVWDLHSARLNRRLASAGRPHFYLRLPWATHGCDFFFSGPSGQISTYAIERFLSATLFTRPTPEQ